MHKINWASFENDSAIRSHLATLPRYRNTSLKSFYFRLKFFLQLVLCKITRKDKPLFMVLATNNDCNLDCGYCYGEYGKRSNKNNFTTRRLLEIIDELKELGCCLLTIHGGESLLRADIGEILNYCKWKGFYVSFNTNGYLVPKRIEEIACVDTLIFSLDGREESNDRVRGEGSFRKVMEAIKVAAERRIPLVISATLTTYNEAPEDMEFLAALGKEKGIRIQYSLLYNREKLIDDRTDSDQVLSNEGTRKLVRKIQELKKQGFPIYYNDAVLKNAIDWPESYDVKHAISKDELPHPFSKKLIPCYHGKLKFQIDADGRIVRCWAQDKKEAPNLHALGVREALKACGQDDHCRHCAYLANNEHNAMMDLNPRGVLHVASIQIADALKIGIGKRSTRAKLTTPCESL